MTTGQSPPVPPALTVGHLYHLWPSSIGQVRQVVPGGHVRSVHVAPPGNGAHADRSASARRPIPHAARKRETNANRGRFTHKQTAWCCELPLQTPSVGVGSNADPAAERATSTRRGCQPLTNLARCRTRPLREEASEDNTPWDDWTRAEARPNTPRKERGGMGPRHADL